MSHLPNKSGIDLALDAFREACAGARRFHSEALGKGVNPDHCLGDWLTLVKKGDRAAIEKKYPASVEKSQLLETSGPTGGYLVPPELSVAMMRDLSTKSLLRRYGAFTVPMAALQVQLPLPDVSTVQAAGTAPYFGGMQMSWLAGSQNQFPATGMAFRDVTLTAWQLGGYVYTSNPFLQDAVGVEAWLTHLFGGAAAYYQDLAFFQGTGVGQPQGIVAAKGSYAVARKNAGTVDQADAQGMLDNLLPSGWDEACRVWFCHPSVVTILPTFTGWIPNGPLQMYGIPIVPTGKCSTLGTPGDLILAVPSLYLIGDRMQVEIAYAAEEPTAWKSNQSAFRIFSRVDGQPAIAAPVTLQNAQSQVSPFVVLN